MQRLVIFLGLLVALCFLGFLPRRSVAQGGLVGIYTYHGDIMRTGWNARETLLTQTTVHSPGFGRLWSVKVDGQVYAQPLYVPAVDMGTAGTHHVILVATENDSVYAFDADAGGSSPLWKAGLGLAVPSRVVKCANITPQYGITGTPVIDPATLVLYTVAKTWGNNQQRYHLHALDVRSGQERPGWPVEIKGSVPGDGGGSVGGQITFDPSLQLQRPGLLLLNGRIIIAFGSHCDDELTRYHGWVFSYSASDPTQSPSIFNTTPDAVPTGRYQQAGGGIWQSGFGLAADDRGDIYFETGNGLFTADQGGRSVGNSFVRLATAAGALSFTPEAANFYTPAYEVIQDYLDLDLGSGGAMVIPDQPNTTTPRLLVGSGKDGVIRLLNRDFLGGFAGDGALQSIPSPALSDLGAIYGGPAYWEGPAGPSLFYTAHQLPLQRLRLGTHPDGSGASSLIPDRVSNDLFGVLPPGQSAIIGIFPDTPTPVVSSNERAAGTGIVWLLRRGDNTLRAYNAEDLSLLWHSSQNNKDALRAPVMKFAVPIVVNGKVYAGTENSVVCYGLH
jgi:putative pyrroloquinoline-quinone binding quinoprotein/putative pyrroloquinoline-quinone-binding quinoprotein